MSKTLEFKMSTKINITTIDFTQKRQEKVNAIQKEMEIIINSSFLRKKFLILKTSQENFLIGGTHQKRKYTITYYLAKKLLIHQ